MDRVNQYAFYQFGASLGELRQLKSGAEHIDFVIATYVAQEAIILLGVVTSAITAMVEEMKRKGLTSAPSS